jgi:purine-binding chemotaxis protein CheW
MKKPQPAGAARTPTDWSALRRRAERALAVGDLEPARQAAAVLEARARALAQGRQAETSDDALRLVRFSLAGESHAVEAEYVKEVTAVRTITRLPGLPPFIRGIAHVRGRVVAVNDFRQLLGLAGAAEAGAGSLVVLGGNGMELGLLVDEILGVAWLPTAALQPPLPSRNGAHADWLQGVGPDQLAVWNAERILADPRVRVDGR